MPLITSVIRRRAGRLARAVTFLLGPSPALILCAAVHAAQNAPPPPEKASPRPSDAFETLRERVRTTALPPPAAPGEGPPLFIGGRYGGRLFILTTIPDPLMPNTLDVNFDHWNLSARVSLLLDYARLRTEADAPRSYAGIPEQQRHDLQTREAESRARSLQVVEAGSYEEKWRPFLAAYRELVEAVDKVLPRTDTTPDRARDESLLIDRVARERGLHELVRELRFDAADVSSEIMRLLTAARGEQGATDVATDDGSNLLYACESDTPAKTQDPPDRGKTSESKPSPRPLSVRVHTWHRLAPVVFRAWTSAEKGPEDSKAVRIATQLRALQDEINSWARSHHEASSAAIDQALNRMAADRGLIRLLETYDAAESR